MFVAAWSACVRPPQKEDFEMNAPTADPQLRIDDGDRLLYHLTEAWRNEDECFDLLIHLYLQCRTGEVEKVEGVRIAMGEHQKTCGGCFQRVMTSAITMKDPFRRRVYYNIHELSSYEFIKYSGGDYEVTPLGSGSANIRLVYPPEDRVYCAGIEINTVKGSPRDSWLVVDVLSESDFKNPNRILDAFDRLDVDHVKNHNEPALHILQWLVLSSDQPHELRVRWEGRVKTLAPSARFIDRYSKLIRRLRDAYATDRAVQAEPLEIDTTEETLALREMALEYDGSSPFPSFLKARFSQRQIDGYRHESLDAVHSTNRGDLPTPGRARDGADPEDAPGMGTVAADAFGSGEDVTVNATYEAELDAKVVRELTPRERRVYNLKRFGANDRQAGEVMGIARETVNRDKAKIKKVVARIVEEAEAELLPRANASRPVRKNPSPDHT
jgi:DNA-binding CsgD family transcriptional regulator